MEIFILLALILVNFFIVVSEISLISARRSRIESLANKGDEKAKKAIKLIDKPERFLSAAQIVITGIAIMTGIFAEDKFSEELRPVLERYSLLKAYAQPLSTTIVVILITFVSVIFGELIPKKMAMLQAEKIAMASAGAMDLVSSLFHPFVWLLSESTKLIFKLFNIKKPSDAAVTEEEIKAMISEGSESGSIEEDEKEIIERVFHLGDRNITSLMTHRTDIAWLDLNDTVEIAKSKLTEIIYSTYPVCEGTIDEIKGLIYVKDLLKADPQTKLASLVKPTLFVPENNSAYQLLEKIKTSRIHACFIVSEYGTLEGMVTLNDILEAIIGDMPQAGQEEYEIFKREDGTYLVDALIQFYDFLIYFDRADWMNEGEQEFDTLAGFVLHELEHIPTTGESFSWKDFHFEIIDMDGQRIDKILVKISEELKEELEEQD
jgi:putative hemolysin